MHLKRVRIESFNSQAAWFFVIILKFIFTSIFEIKIHGKKFLDTKKISFSKADFCRELSLIINNLCSQPHYKTRTFAEILTTIPRIRNAVKAKNFKNMSRLCILRNSLSSMQKLALKLSKSAWSCTWGPI